MRNKLYILGLLATVCGGCAMKPAAPPVVYNPVDVIASGRPPLYFVVSRPGAVDVIDVTTQSRVSHIDISNQMATGVPLTLRLDADSRALTMAKPNATQPSDSDVLLPVDPSHIFAVTFAPDFKATPPATMPAK